MVLNQKYPIRYFVVVVMLALLSVFLAFHVEKILDGVIIFIGLGVIFIYLIGKKEKDYFDPMYLFSIYYVLVYVSALAVSAQGFENNIFISSTYFYSDIESIYTLALFVCLASYFSVLFGYHLLASKRLPVRLSYINGIESQGFYIIAMVIYFFGFCNFLYNVNYLYSLDFFAYFKNISVRHIDFEVVGTTLGYHFIYAGAYMLYVRALQLNRGYLVAYGLVFLSVIVFASSGRIANTIFYLVSFLMIYYYNRGGVLLNKRFFVIGLAIALLGVVFYAMRYASSLSFNNMYDFSEGGFLSYLSDFFRLDSLIFFLVDKGNIPNFPVLMKVIDSWERDIGYMFGMTLFHPAYGFISNDLFGMIPMPAVTTKQVWYSHILGGNLPVTGMGEMVLNFSIAGVYIGMFLFGALGALMRNIFLNRNSNIYLVFYSKFCLFFLLYAKGEFNNLNIFWMAFPAVIFLFSVSLARSIPPRYKNV